MVATTTSSVTDLYFIDNYLCMLTSNEEGHVYSVKILVFAKYIRSSKFHVFS